VLLISFPKKIPALFYEKKLQKKVNYLNELSIVEYEGEGEKGASP
jgi:hypothetical protein